MKLLNWKIAPPLDVQFKIFSNSVMIYFLFDRDLLEYVLNFQIHENFLITFHYSFHFKSNLNLFFVGESADDSRFSSFHSHENALIFSFLKGIFLGCSVLGWLFFIWVLRKCCVTSFLPHGF